MVEKIYHGIQLADGEEIIRDYHAAVQKRPKMNIYLAVTTRRLLFAGESKRFGGRGLYMNDVYTQDISGISAFSGRISLIWLILGLVMIIIGGVIYFEVPFIGIIIGILLILVGLYFLIYTLLRRKLGFIEIFSKGGMSAISLWTTYTRRGSGVITLGWNAKHIRPGPDFERLVNELSACVMDLQSDPENALKKWGTAVRTETD